MNLILEVNNISYSAYLNNEEKTILQNISFTLEKNSVLGIAGESGSGKTTLAKILAAIIKPTSGDITYHFEKNERKISPVQILFQNTGDIINPLREVKDILIESLKIGGKNNINLFQLDSLLDSVKLPKNLLERKGFELSGGEQQRVALARILAVKPELLILDEPFSAQDYESQQNFLNLFLDLKKNLNITMICIAHNLKLLRQLADEVMILYSGKIVEMNKSEELFEKPQHNYTKFLLHADSYDLTYEEIKNNLTL